MTAPILYLVAPAPTAVSTEPLYTQLTPSSAVRARRERRHPKASKSLKTELSPLDPLENSIRRKRKVCFESRERDLRHSAGLPQKQAITTEMRHGCILSFAY